MAGGGRNLAKCTCTRSLQVNINNISNKLESVGWDTKIVLVPYLATVVEIISVYVPSFCYFIPYVDLHNDVTSVKKWLPLL